MKTRFLGLILLLACTTASHAGLLDEAIGKAIAHKASEAAKAKANKKIAARLNTKLIAESQKNQCGFKGNTSELAAGCDRKSKRLASALIKAKKALQKSGQAEFTFTVYGHTDLSGDASDNKALSKKRAEAILKELVAHGVDADDIQAIGMGSEKPLIKPDNTPAKMARNRRYEVQITF